MQNALNRRPAGKNDRSIDPESRRRVWLDSYEATTWTLSDSAGSGADQTLSFDVRMADGRSLLDHHDLYATAKELVFWIRAGTYTRLDDALRHKQYGETMLRLCYGLTARGIFSVSALTSIDIDDICEEAAFGVDGLTNASQLLKKQLEKYQSWDAVPSWLHTKKEFSLQAAIEAFNLPQKWARAELKSELESVTARLNGKVLVSVADSKTQPITIQNIQIVTMVFEALFTLRHFIEAPSISFRPFKEGAAQRAAELGRTSDRTPIPPPDLVLKLLEESTRYIVAKSDAIIAEYQELMHIGNLSDWQRKKGEALRQRISDMATASYILIAAFTARRSDEIKKLGRECLKGNDRDGWWMQIYIEKTERQLSWMPIPRIVARAVTTLQMLVPFDLQSAEPLLFRYMDPVSREFIAFDPKLNPFADSVGAREYANDNNETKTWSWVSRQFRRFFAVLFFYRYRGKIETLAHQLRHFNLEMTNDYVTLDPDNAKIWAKEVWNFQIEIAKDVVTGRSLYKGPMGERLTKLYNRLRDKFSSSILIVSERAAKVLLRQMKKNQMVLTPKPWATCTCPRNKAGCGKAACRKLAGFNDNDAGPDFAAAGPTVCPGCPWALIGPENFGYIDDQLEAMRVDAASLDHQPTIFAELQAANVLTLSQFKTDLAA
jgi:hypothetical protein